MSLLQRNKGGEEEMKSTAGNKEGQDEKKERN
jgi:hypothetical protein